jgi:hypothetical protein
MKIAVGVMALASFLLVACSGPQGPQGRDRPAKKEQKAIRVRQGRRDQKATRVRQGRRVSQAAQAYGS